MKRLMSAAATAAAVLFVSDTSFAEECSGSNARVNAAPVILHKAEDGTVTMFLSSTGASTVITPTSKANTGWQHCSGIFITKADKSSSGSGICYRVDQDGDTETVSWSLDGNNRTWKRESGTGSMSGAASGTWESGVTMGDGLSIGAWKGNCEW